MRFITFALALFFISYSYISHAVIYGIDITKTELIKDSSFQGDEIMISGLVRGGTNIITSVTGPTKGYNIWKKERLYGIWLNAKRLYIPATFSFYQIYSTNSLEKISDYETLKILGFNLDYNDYFSHETYEKEEMVKFNHAFKEYQQSVGQYLDAINPIELIGGSIFRIRIKLNKTVPVGEYGIKIAEFENGKLTQTESLKFEVKQSEFFASIDNMANNSPIIYAIIAIFIAIIIGGVTGVILNGEKI